LENLIWCFTHSNVETLNTQLIKQQTSDQVRCNVLQYGPEWSDGVKLGPFWFRWGPIG